jgi:hypothetical protein
MKVGKLKIYDEMNKKDNIQLGNYIINILQANKEGSAHDVANAALYMCRALLREYPRLRGELFLWNKEEFLDELQLDYGELD